MVTGKLLLIVLTSILLYIEVSGDTQVSILSDVGKTLQDEATADTEDQDFDDSASISRSLICSKLKFDFIINCKIFKPVNKYSECKYIQRKYCSQQKGNSESDVLAFEDDEDDILLNLLLEDDKRSARSLKRRFCAVNIETQKHVINCSDIKRKRLRRICLIFQRKVCRHSTVL